MLKKRYDNPRPKIPAAIQRQIKIEARHSCMVCLERVSLQLHHIDENRENNNSDNIICICSNCHGMVHDGKITQAELRVYKQKAKERSIEVDEEVQSLREQIKYFQESSSISTSSDFAKLQLKYQNLLNDLGGKMIFYQAFIYLVPEFFLDERGAKVRALVRELLDLSQDEEGMIISHLKSFKLVETVGELIYLKDKTDAKLALSELIDSKKINLEKILEKFSNL
jgi:hypothetical protein